MDMGAVDAPTTSLRPSGRKIASSKRRSQDNAFQPQSNKTLVPTMAITSPLPLALGEQRLKNIDRRVRASRPDMLRGPKGESGGTKSGTVFGPHAISETQLSSRRGNDGISRHRIHSRSRHPAELVEMVRIGCERDDHRPIVQQLKAWAKPRKRLVGRSLRKRCGLSRCLDAGIERRGC